MADDQGGGHDADVAERVAENVEEDSFDVHVFVRVGVGVG